MKALIIVDIQKDFLPGGTLAVPEGDDVIPVVNRLAEDYPLIAATQDWHPPGHLSFASSHEGRKPFETVELDGLEQILWPDHCTWGSTGAAFPKSLDTGRVAAVFRKGMDPRVDSYSGFFDNGHRHKTGLAEWLRGMEVDALDIVGLAAEVCVAHTARDAAALGFATTLLTDGTPALSEDDFAKTLDDLRAKGVRVR